MNNENIEWLNQAQIEDLEKVGGIDRQKAEEIINFREEKGEFKNWEDLKNIPGMNNEMVEVLRSQGEEEAEDDDEEEEEN